MAKKKPAKGKEYTLIKKRSGRYAVLDKDGNYVHGDAKVEILLKEKLIKKPAKAKKKEEKPEEKAEEAAEAPAEEATE